jgi:PBSX family phage terminase large subunit
MTSVFSKTLKQREAIPILAKHKYAALYGGSRSGKTFIIIYALIVRAAKVKSRHAIIRKTFNSVKRAIWLDTLPKVLQICFPDLPVKWDKTNYYITLPNGSEIWLCGLDNAARAEKILGMEFSTEYFNEASELDYSAIQVAVSRLAEKNELIKRVWFDFNPPAKSHFSYWLFIKKLNPISSEPLLEPDSYGCMVMNPKDNLDNIDEEYIRILEQMPEKDRQRFLEGMFSDDSDGQAYYAFDRERHVAATRRLAGTLHVGMDFNVQPMTAVIFQVYDNKIHVLDEAFLENSDTYKMCDHLKKKGYVGNVIPDSTGKNRKTSGKSDHNILREAGFNVVPTRNPFVTDRVNNLNRLFTDDRIIIDPKCKKLIGDLEKVVWKNEKLDQKTDSMLTHISDALGYGAWKLMPINGAIEAIRTR